MMYLSLTVVAATRLDGSDASAFSVFTLAVACPFCCTACYQLLMCHTHQHDEL
jgi:hypothetical protein